MRGRIVVVETKNEVEVTGTLEETDYNLNLTLVNARQVTPRGEILQLETAFVPGRAILYVHIPDDVDVISNLHRHV
ncbi:unnamed protein product, partial [Phaeothamnion confervicola]